ncbi:hypothetical protein OXX59_000872 [Metschnikowia pulcherrima]
MRLIPTSFALLTLWRVSPALCSDSVEDLTGDAPHDLESNLYPETETEHRPNGTSIQIPQETAGERLNWFIGRLRTFVHGKDFDVRGFDWHSDRLRGQLFEVYGRVILADVHHRDIWYQYLYAKEMFQTMLDASEIIKFYGHVNTLPHGLINIVAHLNVQLMTLFTLQGHPDVTRHKYSDIVLDSMSSLDHWISMFERVANVPIPVQVAFQNQASHAKSVLRVFQKWV